MLYFAYGSNMPYEQINCSDPDARFEGVAELADYRLEFTRFSKKQQCGVADVVPSTGRSVWGVLWEVSEAGFTELDKREGVRYDSYKRESMVVSVDESDVDCVTYVVVDKGGPFYPSTEYLGLLVRGAIEHELPSSYLKQLKELAVAENIRDA